MDVLDGIIIFLALCAALHGIRVGAAAQLLTFFAFVIGLAIGVALVVAIAPHIDGQLEKAVVALVLVFVPAGICSALGRVVGLRISGLLRRARFGRIDAIAGAAIAIASTLTVAWLCASILVNSAFPEVSRQIDESRILRRVDAEMPPIPNAFAAVERYLSNDGFPQVIANILPESLGPVNLPTKAQQQGAIARAGPSTVKIVALGCGDEQEGSGFAVGDDLVVTNAHVIAGTSSITVLSANGQTSRATPVLFDDRFDLAILRVQQLDLRPLAIDTNVAERGQGATVLGYPEGGPFTATGAGIESRFDAQGRDIYDSALTDRIVYEIEANVRPGNSGGPLVTSSGEAIGVVFSRSASDPEIGYALASPGVAQRVDEARSLHTRVSTLGCVA